MADDVRAWSSAWEDAAFGDAGFYRRDDGRAEQHFATRVTDGPATARAILELAIPTLRTLVREHDVATVTDVGAGNGTLLRQLAGLLPDDLSRRVRWRGIDLRAAPVDLPSAVEWLTIDVRDEGTRPPAGPGVVVAHELLDDIPCDVIEVDDDGRLRLVLVDRATGAPTLGPDLDEDDACRALGVDAASAREWLAHWWPRAEPAARLEVGGSRDATWRAVTGIVSDGLAIAIDYGHVRADREAGAWDGGTLAGFRLGRLVPPVPDGSCNITAHVAIDSCAASVADPRTRLVRPARRDGLWWLIQDMGA